MHTGKFSSCICRHVLTPDFKMYIMALWKHLSVSLYGFTNGFDLSKLLQVRMQNLFLRHVMIVCIKSINFKREADDVINQILHIVVTILTEDCSLPLSIFSE